MDPMIFFGESDWELRPTQRLQSYIVDMPDLPCIRSKLSIALGRLVTADDEVDLSIG
jgi:hypothetical protein